ncbi:MAG: HPr-rel-A system PqqD family peptide chaperone [Methylococcales bacterium]
MFENNLIGLPIIAVIHCRFWDDECVIYNQLTGDVHLIDGMGVEVFKVLSKKAASRIQLLKNLNSVFEWEMDFNAEDFLDNLINEYQKLGLVEVTKNTCA